MSTNLKTTSLTRPAIYISIFVVAQLALILLVISTHSKAVNACPKSVGTQTIHITSYGFQPRNSSVKVCTEVVFANEDSRAYLPAFGAHDHHVSPPGFSEKVLAKPSDTNEFIASSPGILQFHEHLYDQFTGQLTVTP